MAFLRRPGVHRLALAGLALLATSLLFTSKTTATEGRIPIYQSGYITASGSYYLTRDIAVSSFGLLGISASNVTLDLNGHTLTSTYGSGGYVINSNGYTHVRITNGNIVGGGYGIYLANDSGDFQVDHVRVSGSANVGIYVAGTNANPARAVVEDNVVMGAANNGIYLFWCNGSSVRRNVVEGAGVCGIRLYNCNGNDVSYNTCTASYSNGIEVDTSNRNAISHNTSTGSTVNYGVFLINASYNRIDWNLIADNAYGQLTISTGCSGNIYAYNRALGTSPWNITGATNISGGGNCDQTGPPCI